LSLASSISLVLSHLSIRSFLKEPTRNNPLSDYSGSAINSIYFNERFLSLICESLVDYSSPFYSHSLTAMFLFFLKGSAKV